MFHNIDNAGGNMKSLKKPKLVSDMELTDLANNGSKENKAQVLDGLPPDNGDDTLSLFEKYISGNSGVKSRILIHEDSPIVLYDRWLFHRSAKGKLIVNKWRNQGNAGYSNYATRKVGVPILGDFTLSNISTEIEEVVTSFILPPNIRTNTSTPYCAGHSVRHHTPNIPRNQSLTFKFVVLDENNNRVFDKDYGGISADKGTKNLTCCIQNTGKAGDSNPTSCVNRVVELEVQSPYITESDFNGNYEIFIKKGANYYLWIQKLEGNSSPNNLGFDWDNVPTDQTRIWSGRTPNASVVSSSFGYHAVEVIPEIPTRRPAEDNPVILRGNPNYIKYIAGATIFSRVVRIATSFGNKYVEFYRTDTNNTIPLRIKTTDPNNAMNVPSYVIERDGSYQDSLAASPIYDYIFTDLDGDRIWCSNVEQIIRSGEFTEANFNTIDTNCWRKLRLNASGTPIAYNDVDPSKKARLDSTINDGKPYFIRVPKQNDSSFLLTEFDHNSPNDGTVWAYDDNSDRLTIERTEQNLIIQNNTDAEQKPALIEAYGRMWASSGRFVRFSKPGQPEYWPPNNSLSFNDNITGLLQVSNGILVFTADETYLVVGTKLDDFAITLLTKEQGCIAPRSCGYIQSVPIWMCKDGIATYEGGRVIVRSRPIISDELMNEVIEGFICAEVHNEQYFILYNKGNTTQLLVMDLRYGVSFYTMDGAITNDVNIRDIRVYEDTFYAIGTDNKLYEMFKSEDYYPIHYKSPIITEGSTTILKEIDCIYISVKDANPFSVKATVNGKSKYLLENVNVAAISQEMSIAEEDRRFEQIQVEITGIVGGYIREIRFLSTAADKKLKEFV